VHANVLRALIGIEGPFASVYLDNRHDTEDAGKQFELTWRAIRHDLATRGANDDLFKTLDDAVTAESPPARKGGRALIATSDRVLVDQELVESPAEQAGRISAAPYLVPLVRHGDVGRSYVVAVVDQVGVTVTVVDGMGRTSDKETTEGRHHAVHKVRSGGPGHRDMQAHTEEVVRQNLQQAADEIVSVTQRNAAGLVILAGEVQSRSALLDLLPEHTRELTHPVTAGSRGTPGELDTAVNEVISGQRLARLDELAERFRSAGGHGLAVHGLGPVMAALREANVETLLIGTPVDQSVAVGDDPAQVGNAQELNALGVADPRELRADEAVPFAAVAVGADLVAVNEHLELEDGFGAVLRHG